MIRHAELAAFCLNDLEGLRDSLKKEYGYMMNGADPNELKAKGKQIHSTQFLIDILGSIQEKMIQQQDYIKYLVNLNESDYFDMPDWVLRLVKQVNDLGLPPKINLSELAQFRKEIFGSNTPIPI